MVMAGVTEAPSDVVIAVHGGAGADIRPDSMTQEQRAAYRTGLAQALEAGHTILRAGGSALDAVQATVRTLEDDPLFNAGRGGSLAFSGRAELDAALMDGATKQAGAVAGVTETKNPILLARAVMEQSPHVLLVGEGADEFSRSLNLEQVANDYFRTPERITQWEHVRALGRPVNTAMLPDDMTIAEKVGTVGAVARDAGGNLAAATSTGGMAGKRWGRVGDSPIIGAGTWADNRTCAVSATGVGEFFICYGASHDIAARMEYAGATVRDAAHTVIHDVLFPVGGEGGLIALDAQGNAALPFNTPGMFRGWITSDGAVHTAIFHDGE